MCQRDQGTGDTRKECPLGLIRALLSGLRFLSITENGTKERDMGIWLEFQRALASASLSSLGLVFVIVFFILFLFFSPLQIIKFVIRQRREERLRKPEQQRIFRVFYFIMTDVGKSREILMRKKIIRNEKVK